VELCVPHIFYQDIDGILDIQKTFEENSVESNFFISGPPSMIKAFKQALIGNGVPAANVSTDDWERGFLSVVEGNPS
jgi:ferredoxin-NADP reductase